MTSHEERLTLLHVAGKPYITHTKLVDRLTNTWPRITRAKALITVAALVRDTMLESRRKPGRDTQYAVTQFGYDALKEDS